ncbi:Enoyl-CoA hydratase/carnithine racemase [Oceanospirillum multiglobuliferum]|uniref:3-hydroxyisobutyryl-CoA hydrolase n=1 Tax=Oceanospirillum multiglobuliferum TaxID=64969 RepID=A0A1T4PRJ4_9GAMM|nr:enoyl-CoA hydratase/isomerase family protein [Oceanospirillum multiglobuliferum]OPX55371.1 enoyl-CoA hydratase [Oceanospirillum multiglobuliferum]SJZ93817.1 Enoyl-CoA hydratase/carnithine racemase [Oceanospirillum multiglobuliferum]
MSDSPAILDPVVFEELATRDGHLIGIATLNAPKALNALSLEMIDLLYPKLLEWQANSSVVAVWLQGSGDKAFCAGGDIVQLYNSMVEHGEQQNPYAEKFFTDEYRLDHLIHTYSKPFILWGNGIVMGGGLGLMAGASHRVVTESSRIAMPEISIGLYPDVGGSFFLNRMPGRTGLFLGLTGASINAADALFVGLGDRFVTHDRREAVIDALLSVSWADNATHIVNSVLRQHERASLGQLPESEVRKHFDLIQQLTDGDDVAAIVDNITSCHTDDKWLSRAIGSLAVGSPTAMHLIVRQLKATKQMSLAEVFRAELDLSVQAACKGEFAEGIRALLIDKDRQPKWHGGTLAAVEAEWIDSFFVSPWSGEHPLADLK